MTDTKDDGGPAFPAIELAHNQAVPVVRGGMSLRQWYTGLAMQGWLASDITDELTVEKCAELSVRQADALIAELKK